MNRSCLRNPCSLALSLLALLWLAPVSAVDLPLRAFTATYKLYESGMHIANTELSLDREGEFWHWRMETIARGVFAWFTDKKPVAETVFSKEPDEIRIHRILITDGTDKDRKREIAIFNWDSNKIEVLRKGKSSEIDLQHGIYDQQSLHLLAAEMDQQKTRHRSVNYYRKGKIVKSSLVANGERSVNVNGNSIDALVYEQRITGSEAKLRYYYDAQNPILPLRIEKLEAGDNPTVMTLEQVDWKL